MKKRNVLIMLSLLAAVCITAGCNTSTVQETTTTTTAVESTTTVTTVAEITTSAEGTDSELPELEVDYVDEYGYTYYKNPTIWTTERIFEELTINGQKFEAPLTLEKLGEGYNHSTDGGFYDESTRTVCLRLMYNDKSLAWVYLDDCDSMDDTKNKDYKAIVFSVNDIHEEYKDSININSVELLSSYEKLLNRMGTPTVDDGYNKNYTADTSVTENHNFSYSNYSVKFYVLEDEVLMISINM